jgi:hypothetical protein
MLGADVVVAEPPRLVLGQHQDMAGSVGEAFEHGDLRSQSDMGC